MLHKDYHSIMNHLKLLGGALAGTVAGTLVGVLGHQAYLKFDDRLNYQSTSLSTSLSTVLVDPTNDAKSVFEKLAPFGLPITQYVLNKGNYVVGYNPQTRTPHYVLEHLTRENISVPTDGPVSRAKMSFREEHEIPYDMRAHLSDFHRSGYDRGHLAPAADHRSSEDRMRQTFDLSNAAPQVGDGFNRHYWARFESFTRHLTSRFDDVYVVTGLLYLPTLVEDESTESSDKSHAVVQYEMIGNPPNVAVPTHFYKIVLGKKADTMSLGCFVMPNKAIEESTPLTSFWTPLPLLEKWSGVQFFPQLRSSTDSEPVVLGSTLDAEDQFSTRELLPHTRTRFKANLCSLCELEGSCELPPPYVPRSN